MKLKAKELRIGNLIYVSSPNSDLLEVRDKTIEECNYHHITDLCRSDKDWKYEPIPLTIERLLELGAIKRIDGGYNLSGQNVLVKDGRFLIMTGALDFIDITTVHQLQNMIFSIEEKELVFKPNK